MRSLLLILLRGYRWFLSPLKVSLFGPSACCRHVPSCSAYAEEALRVHGAARGSWLTLRRVGRCHPWGTSGWDPVPRIQPGDRVHADPAVREFGALRLPVSSRPGAIKG